MHNVFKRIFDVISYIIIALLIIYALNVVYFRFIKKEQTPRIFNYYIFNILTGSMEDTIHVNDYIIVKKTKNVKVNDIVTYRKDGVFITHRIIKIDGDKYITKGDANNTEDDPITKDQILGKYVKKSKIIGFIIKYKFLLVAIAILIYVLNTMFKMIKK